MRFKLFDIPVYIHPTFWIFLIFFTDLLKGFSIHSLLVGGIVFLSLLVHEYGHALTAKYFGANPSITLEAFGGRAEYPGARLSPKQHFLITLNGPLLESLLIALPYAFLKLGIFASSAYMVYTLKVMMHLNILWCLLNLIPIAPLDGGHLLRYFLEKRFGIRGTKASLYIGVVAAVICLPYLYFKGFLFFGTLLILFGFQNAQLLILLKKQKRTPSSRAPRKSSLARYLEALELLKEKDLPKAKKILKSLLRSKDPHIKLISTEALAKVYLSEEKKQEAYDLLLAFDSTLLQKGKVLLCELAFEQGNYTLIAKFSREIYDLDPSYEVAVLNSKAYGHLTEPMLAGAWLETASQFARTGDQESLEEILKDPAYLSVQEEASFKAYLEKILGKPISV